MRNYALSLCFVMFTLPAFTHAQEASDSTTNINNNTTTDSTVNSTSTSNNTNTNNNTNVNTNTSVNTNTNTNVNTSTNTNYNNNVSTNTNNNTNNNTNTNNTTINSTSNNTNTNINTSTSNNTNNNTNTNINTTNTTSNSTSDINQNVNSNTNANSTSNNTNNNTSNNTNNNYSESSSESKVETKNENTNRNENINKSETTIKSPPPSAIAPSIGSSYSQDLCTTGVSGAVQTQIFGLAAGKSVRDMNCERIKLSKTMYDMGMKVAAVSLMCQDERVWNAMRMAGTPCPFEGQLGDDAKEKWEKHPNELPDGVEPKPRLLVSNSDIEYQTWTKEEFCAEYPDEAICE